MRVQNSAYLFFGSIALVAVAAVASSVYSTASQARHPVEFDSALVMSPQVKDILTRSCADCHSMSPHLPWYANLPPASWMIQSDMRRARKAMNLTDWSRQNGKTAGAAVGTLAAMCADVRSARMPDKKYLILHSEAKLSPTEIATFCGWTAQQMARSKPIHGARAALR